MKTTSPKTWFITGVSSGFGREIAREALRRGDIVAGTLRHAEQLAAFEAEAPGRAIALQMDVTKDAQVRAALDTVVSQTGRIDVVVNNAGYGLLAALEETTDDKLERNLATNLIAPLRIMRTVIPIMRRQQSGHIVNISTIAGFANELGFSVYGAAKAGLEAAADAVAGEVAPFGIKVTTVVPGPVRTDFIGRSLDPVERLPEYTKTVGQFEAFLNKINGRQPGDPTKAAAAIYTATAAVNPPRRLTLGAYAYDKMEKKIAELQSELAAWKDLGLPTDFPA